MRRTLVLALAALALLGVVVPDAFAQAPTPTFRINGLIDQVGSYSRNTSITDQNLSRSNDELFYFRTRGRLDFIGMYGKTKAVVGIEIDSIWGQFGANDTTGFGTAGTSFDQNTDTLPSIETKWVYTEFEVPLIPVPTVVRLGAQPFGSAGTYKLAFANGDFAGVNVVSTSTPTCCPVHLRGLGGGGHREEDFPGPAPAAMTRVHHQPRVSPMKGLDIKPVYSYIYVNATGSRSGASGWLQQRGVVLSLRRNLRSGRFEYRYRRGQRTVGLTPLPLWSVLARSNRPVPVRSPEQLQHGEPGLWILCNTTGTGSLSCTKDKADISAGCDVRGSFRSVPCSWRTVHGPRQPRPDTCGTT
jgi:hypothetical protein